MRITLVGALILVGGVLLLFAVVTLAANQSQPKPGQSNESSRNDEQSNPSA